MARNGIDADQAYELLKSRSHHSGHKPVEIAEALTTANELLRPSTD